MAEIHQLPRFQGEPVRQLPGTGEVIPYCDALRLLAKRAGEWEARIQGMLTDGPFYASPDGRDHVMVDGATLEACGKDIAAIHDHLHRMAKLIEDS